MSFAERIAEYKWRNRLIFLDDEADARLAEQKKLLGGSEPGFEERCLIPLYLVGDIEARKGFGVEDGAFAAILIGRDGTEKHRFGRPVEPDEVFRRIDEMPMRRREMGWSTW